MPRDDESLIDIENATHCVLRFACGVDRPTLEANDEKVSAILYQITIIGEATKRLSSELRQQHPEIPWRDIARMQDVTAHEYDQVDLDVVWDVIQNKLPELLTLLHPLLPTDSP